MRVMNREQGELSHAADWESPDVGVCASCGYDLRGLAQARCPECGRPFDRDALRGGSAVWCKTTIRYLRAAAIVQIAACGVMLSPLGPVTVLLFILMLPIFALVAGYGRKGLAHGYVDLCWRIWPVEDIVNTYWRNIAGASRAVVMIVVPFVPIVAICAGMTHWVVSRGLVLAAGILLAMFVVRRYRAGVRCNKDYGVRPGIGRSLRRAYVLNIVLMAASALAIVVIGSMYLIAVPDRYRSF